MDFYELLQENAKQENIGRLVIGGVVETDGKYILLERTDNKFMKNLLEIPSGKIYFGETILECLHRQVKEELGKNIRAVKKYLGHFDYLSDKGILTRQYNFLIDLDSTDNIKLSEEHKAVYYLTNFECEQSTNISPELMFILNVANSYNVFQNLKEKK